VNDSSDLPKGIQFEERKLKVDTDIANAANYTVKLEVIENTREGDIILS